MDSDHKQPPLHPVHKKRHGLIHCRVIDSRAGTFVLEMDGHRIEACLAFGCLVAPQPEDLVLCDCSAPDNAYILSVLERPRKTTTVLKIPGEMVLHAESATVLCRNNLNFLSNRETHKTTTAVLDMDTITATGKNFQASFHSIRVLGQFINTMARHAVERFTTYLRRTEDHDQLQSGQLTQKIEGLYCMQSRHTIMVSEKDTKIDGERIHMG